jgi:RNA polymerase sigma factor (sigma-70 family)
MGRPARDLARATRAVEPDGPGLCLVRVTRSLVDASHAPPDAFEQFYRLAWPDLVRFAHLLTGSRARGEEVVQEAFIGYLRHRDTVENPYPYLRRAVINGAANGGRGGRDRERCVDPVPELAALPSADIDETLALLAALPYRQRAVLVLRYYLDMSEAEIAEILSVAPGPVKSAHHRAISRLRKELS